MTTEDQRTGYIDGLRALASILEQHPEIPLPFHGLDGHGPMHIGFHGAEAKERLAEAVRAFPCNWRKNADSNWLNLNGQLAGLQIQLYAAREQVCTRVVTGVEDREVEEEVQPAVTRKVVKAVEVVEWQCQPLLASQPAGQPSGPAPGVESCLACGATDTPMIDGRCNNRMLCAGRAARRAMARDAEAAQVTAP